MNTIAIRIISRNPIQSLQANPMRNWQINPMRNWQINPMRNWQINPMRNWQINPMRNWQINPAHNWHINPLRNMQIDPNRNMQIDPRRNIALDPMRSLNIPGYYVCSAADSNCYYFTVKALTQNIILIFDANKIFSFYAVGTIDCYAVFSVNDMSYVGTLCPNGTGRYNWFTLNGEWQYFFT